MKEYPKDRQRTGFAIRYVKALMQSDCMAIHGPEVTAFAIWIASVEDRLHYTRPVRLWRADIASKFNHHRNAAHARLMQSVADSGLVYRVPRPRGSREQMQFWTLVPDWLEPFFGGLTSSESGTSETVTGSASGTRNGTSGGTSGGTLSIPYTHNPVSGTRKRFQPPTTQEVQSYIQEQSLKVDPSKFVDYYASVGWTIGKGKPMKDWRAAVRNWSRSEKKEQPTEPALKPLKPMRRIHQ